MIFRFLKYYLIIDISNSTQSIVSLLFESQKKKFITFENCIKFFKLKCYK